MVSTALESSSPRHATGAWVAPPGEEGSRCGGIYDGAFGGVTRNAGSDRGPFSITH